MGNTRGMEFSGCTNSKGRVPLPPIRKEILLKASQNRRENPQVRARIVTAGRNLQDDGILSLD